MVAFKFKLRLRTVEGSILPFTGKLCSSLTIQALPLVAALPVAFKLPLTVTGKFRFTGKVTGVHWQRGVTVTVTVTVNSGSA